MPDSTRVFSRSAATPTAPAGSTTSLERSSKNTSARANASSDTVTTSSTSSRMISNGICPGRPTAMPSAMVRTFVNGTSASAASDGGYAAASSACTPITLISRPSSAARPLIAVATPASRPPPPTPMITVSTSGYCSRISRPIVPWPAMMSGWSNGCTNTAPLSSAYASAAASASSTVSPCNTTSAPWSRVAVSLGSATPNGM